jgi:hypothetical protein
MSRTLRIALIASVIFVVIAIIALAIVFSNRITQTSSTTRVLPSVYSVRLSDRYGVTTSSQLITTDGTVSSLDLQSLGAYLVTSLNATHDTLLMLCPSNYTNTKTTADSNVPAITQDPSLGTSLSLTPNVTETVTVTCSLSK